jgi:hypothetical protein
MAMRLLFQGSGGVDQKKAALVATRSPRIASSAPGVVLDDDAETATSLPLRLRLAAVQEVPCRDTQGLGGDGLGASALSKERAAKLVGGDLWRVLCPERNDLGSPRAGSR